MGIPFFILFVLSIAFLSFGITGWGGFVSVEWPQQDVNPYVRFWKRLIRCGFVSVDCATPSLSFEPNYWAIVQCFTGFLLFLGSLYFMGFFLYLEERESGRIMKNVKSFTKLRRFLEQHQQKTE